MWYLIIILANITTNTVFGNSITMEYKLYMVVILASIIIRYHI